MYTTPDDLRAEGVTEILDARLIDLIQEATAEIDRLTGWFFEPRDKRYQLDGRGTPSLELPVPPIHIDKIWVGGGELDVESLIIVGAPAEPGFDGPRITKQFGAFPKGRGNVVIEGVFGYTEPEDQPGGRTPWAIRRACVLLVLRGLQPISDDSAFDARNRWRILEERTRDQSYKLDKSGHQVPVLSGDPDVDALLMRYLRPKSMGAV